MIESKKKLLFVATPDTEMFIEHRIKQLDPSRFDVTAAILASENSPDPRAIGKVLSDAAAHGESFDAVWLIDYAMLSNNPSIQGIFSGRNHYIEGRDTLKRQGPPTVELQIPENMDPVQASQVIEAHQPVVDAVNRPMQARHDSEVSNLDDAVTTLDDLLILNHPSDRGLALVHKLRNRGLVKKDAPIVVGCAEEGDIPTFMQAGATQVHHSGEEVHEMSGFPGLMQAMGEPMSGIRLRPSAGRGGGLAGP